MKATFAKVTKYMRLPTRKSEQLKKQDDDGPLYLTADGVEKLKKQLQRLENDLPQAIADVQRTGEFGDFSENAEYQEAKHRMRRIHASIFSIKEKLKNAVIFSDEGQNDIVRLGSTVVLESESKQKTYYIVGPHETNPTQGRISHVSPLGSVLMGHCVGESITVPKTNTEYKIVKIN